MDFVKQNEHPELFSLEAIGNIPSQAFVFYTNGSSSESGRTGSGVLMRTSTGEHTNCFRNTDHSSVFRSELIAIREALNLALEANADDVWILSSIQYLKNWPNILHELEQNIILKLAALSQDGPACLQWIPWHVGVCENEVAGRLAGEGCKLTTASSH